MRSWPARVGLRAVAGLVVLVSVVVAPTTAEAMTVPRTRYHQQPVTAAPVEPGFPIDHLGVVFDLPSEADGGHDHGGGTAHPGAGDLAVRFRHGTDWGAWISLTEDGAQGLDQWSSALVDGDDADAYQVRGLPAFARDARVGAINTTDGDPVVVGHRPSAVAHAATVCRSRADWGADESIRRGSRSFAPIQVLTVHHTATQNDDPDPAARVRAIYTYHVLTNGWDDIGYQALISEDGTVYEGRWSGTDSPSCLGAGGTGWEFGHAGIEPTADVVTGAHVGGYNTGNFGIALLGTLSTAAPQPAARAALVEYLAELADRHAIDPEATVAYDNGTNAVAVAAISGHRDFSATECPGGVMYGDLPQLRADVAAAVTGDPPPPDDLVDDTTSSETPVYGAVSGSHIDTHAAGGATERISEVPSNGKPSRQHARMEHVWSIDVRGGDTVTLFVDATAIGGEDGFAFGYSVDGGGRFVTALTVPANGSGLMSAPLAAGTSGPVLVRVVDTDRNDASTATDLLAVDHLFIRSEGPGGDPPPPPPDAVVLSASGYKVKGFHHVDLTWTGTASADVYRNGTLVATVSGTAFTDIPGTKGAATFEHKVCVTGTATCSNPTITTF